MTTGELDLIFRLKAERNEALAMLRELEWSGYNGWSANSCPKCDKDCDEGHREGCSLDKLLKDSIGKGVSLQIDNAETLTINGKLCYQIPLGCWGLTQDDTEEGRCKRFIGQVARINGTYYQIDALESFRKMDPMLGEMVVRGVEVDDA